MKIIEYNFEPVMPSKLIYINPFAVVSKVVLAIALL